MSAVKGEVRKAAGRAKKTSRKEGPAAQTPRPAHMEQIYEQLHSRLLEELESGRDRTDEEVWDAIDSMVIAEWHRCGFSLGDAERLAKDLFYSIRKLDILQELMDDPAVTEIMVNGWQKIFYEKEGKIRLWGRSFSSREKLEDIVQQIAGRANRVVNEQRPILDARLADGSRVCVVLRPVALEGPILSIRRFPEEPITMESLVRRGSLTKEAADFLRDAVGARYSIVIGGGTSTGKTTFLNALSSYIPAGERIITIEDNAELQIQGVANLVRMEARSANLEEAHEISIRDLIRTSLRLRPSRIIVGEVRGAEAGDFLVCLNTGHDGSLGTAHANSVRDMISRLEMMVLMGEAQLPVSVIRRQIASGVDLLVHLTRDASGCRRVEEIAEIVDMKGDEVEMATLFGRDKDDRLVARAALTHCEKMDKYRKAQKLQQPGRKEG